jgi:hypothetical protein
MFTVGMREQVFENRITTLGKDAKIGSEKE